MASRTWACTKEQSIASLGGNKGSGEDAHAPVGLYSGNTFRELLDFDVDFTGAYRILRATLVLRRSGQTHIARGGSPRAIARRITSAWTQDGGGENSWSSSASTVWDGPTVAGAVCDSGALGTGDDNGYDRIDVTEIVEAWAPSTVLKSNGQAGSGTSSDRRGIRVASYDEGSATRTTEWFSRRASPASRRPVIEFDYDDNRPPLAPTITSPVGSTDAELVPTYAGTGDITAFLFSDEDATDHCVAVQVQYYGSGATDEAPGTVVVDTGAAAPSPSGPLNAFTVTVTGLPARTAMRKRVRTMDQRGAWGAWTSLAAGYVKTAYIPGAPLNDSMQTTPVEPHIYGTINSLDTGDSLTGWAGEFYLDNSDGTSTVLWASGFVGIGGGTRSDVIYGQSNLSAGMVVRWRHRQWNRDGVGGDWSGWHWTTIESQVGPTITPADTGTKLTSRTGSVTLTFAASSDGYAIRLFRGDERIYPPGTADVTVTIAAASSASVALPAGYVNWGETIGIEAAGRIAGTGVLGDWSPRSFLYVDALPSTTITATDEDGIGGTVIPTLDIVWTMPYLDPDAARYGEDPQSQELDIRVAATPAGSGTIIEERTSVEITGQDTIPTVAHTGTQLEAMDATTGWTAGASATLSAVATDPSGYGGNSLQIAVAGLAAGSSSISYIAHVEDLSPFGSGSPIPIWVYASTITNLSHVRLVFYGAAWTVEYTMTPFADATWYEFFHAKGDPVAHTGTVDWSGVIQIGIAVKAVTGAYTGDIIVRDLRMGTVRRDRTSPDWYVGPEQSLDVRARYRDDATAKLTTTLAAAYVSGTNVKLTSVTGIAVGDDLTLGTTSGFVETRTITAVGTAGAGGTGVDVSRAYNYGHLSGVGAAVYYWGAWTPWLTVKASLPPVVAADTPADRALIVDPTPPLAHTYSSPGSKAQSYRTTRVYRRLGHAYRVLASDPASYWRLAETSSTFADQEGVAVGTVVGGMTRGATGALSPADGDAGVDLNGTTGYIGFGDVYDLATNSPFTIALFIRADALGAGTFPRLVSKELSTDGWRLLVVADTGAVIVSRGASSVFDDASSAAGAVVVGTVVHVAATYDGTTMRVYIDGALSGTPVASSLSLPGNAAPYTIGATSGGASLFDGLVDEHAIWTRALTAEEIAALAAGRLEAPGDQLVYEKDATGTGLTDTLPAFLLATGQAYAWEKTAYDTDALAATTTRRTFTTQFTVPTAVSNLTATTDTAASSIALAWSASGDTYLHHYRVYWRDASGAWVRIDGGPATVDDGETALTTAALTHHGARLGLNQYRVTVHNGSQESLPAEVEATLAGPTTGGSWLLVDESGQYTRVIRALEGPRTPDAIIERFQPPGRGATLHVKWGRSGKRVSLRVQFRPTTDGDLVSTLDALLSGLVPVWLKAPAGWLRDPIWGTVVAVTDTPGIGGMMQATVEFEETER